MALFGIEGTSEFGDSSARPSVTQISPEAQQSQDAATSINNPDAETTSFGRSRVSTYDTETGKTTYFGDETGPSVFESETGKTTYFGDEPDQAGDTSNSDPEPVVDGQADGAEEPNDNDVGLDESGQTIGPEGSTPASETGSKVRTVRENLQPGQFRLVSTTHPNEIVAFPVMPSVSETNNATYNALEPMHMPGGYKIFRGTQSRSYTIEAKLLSRTISEATMNMQRITLLRGWMRPYFGLGTKDSNEPGFGAPPELLPI